MKKVGSGKYQVTLFNIVISVEKLNGQYTNKKWKITAENSYYISTLTSAKKVLEYLSSTDKTFVKHLMLDNSEGNYKLTKEHLVSLYNRYLEKNDPIATKMIYTSEFYLGYTKGKDHKTKEQYSKDLDEYFKPLTKKPVTYDPNDRSFWTDLGNKLLELNNEELSKDVILLFHLLYCKGYGNKDKRNNCLNHCVVSLLILQRDYPELQPYIQALQDLQMSHKKYQS